MRVHFHIETEEYIFFSCGILKTFWAHFSNWGSLNNLEKYTLDYKEAKFVVKTRVSFKYFILFYPIFCSYV